MYAEQTPTTRELTPAQTADLLQRILAAVEKDKRKRWVEIAVAALLSLATVASTWCAYESTLWGGVQTFRLAAANRAGRAANERTIAGMQVRAMEATLMITVVEARHTGDTELADKLHSRLRPQTRGAFEAWLATDPFRNPAAPRTPFDMKEYASREEAEARLRDEEAAAILASAAQANETSDEYVLLTVMFASVLFFGGISGTFESRRLRITMFTLALALFATTVVALAYMPVCRE